MLRQMHWRSVFSATLQLAALGALALAFFMRTPQVSGLSMAPHIAPGEIVLINTMAYRLGKPSRGDIIAFRHETPAPETFIKRIVGLPGDRVRILNGRVYVNARTLAEDYVRFGDRRSFPEVRVPQGALYVLGDNRADSEDSRFFGVVPENAVLGKVLAGIWPAGHLGAL
ncbi:MAG: signal peptidase I [Candidatus Baltobacteraceae bacterium]